MKSKNVLVSLFAIATVLLLASTLSAYSVDGNLAKDIHVKVDGMSVFSGISADEEDYTQNVVPSVIAGENAYIEVYFDSLVNDSAVTIEVEIEGEKVDTNAISEVFDIRENARYDHGIRVQVPFELKDDTYGEVLLHIKIDGIDSKTEIEDIRLEIQRPSYNPEIKSVTFSSNVEAGETFPVDIVLKNMGYNDLDDLYVTVSITELGVSKGPTYFGDLVPIENCDGDCDNEDTISGRIYLDVPYEVKSGSYTLKVEVKNDDTTLSETKTVLVENAVTSNVIASDISETVNVGEEAVFNLVLLNPTNQMKVYRVVTESSGSLNSDAGESVVVVNAGSSQSVKIYASADENGEYTFDVNVFDGENLAGTVEYTLNVEGKNTSSIANPIVILTIVLAVIFLVLLVVLIVLIGKKPSKTEEFGESYY